MKKKTTEYNLLPAQYEFLFGFNKEKLHQKNKDGFKKVYNDVSLYQGGMGSGKTFVGSLRGLMFALQWAGCRGLVGAKSQDLLDNTTKRKYIEHMDNIGFKEGVHYWFKDRGQAIEFKNGSVIRFKTLSDWETFMSEEFTWIEFEEASFIEEIVFIKLITRLRQQERPEWKDYYRCMFLHTNPQGKRGWLNKFFIDPKTRKPSYRYIYASTRENHHLGDEYVEMLEELYSADQIREMVDGIDPDSDNTVGFPDYDNGNVKDKIEYNSDLPLILTCDFNYNPMCWYLLQEDRGTWYVLKELIHCNVTTKQMCDLIQPIIDSYGAKKLIIMGDSHGKDRKTNGSDYGVMTTHFSAKGYDVLLQVQKANPPVKDRITLLRGIIKNAKGTRRLFIDDSCKWLKYNLENAQNNLSNGTLHIPTDKEIQNDPNKLYLIHPIDAVSYPMFFLQRMRDQIGEDAKLG